MTKRFIIDCNGIIEAWKPGRVFSAAEKRYGVDHLFTAKEIARIEAVSDKMERDQSRRGGLRTRTLRS